MAPVGPPGSNQDAIQDSDKSYKNVLHYPVSQKNDTDVAHYNFKPHRPILVIFGRNVAERVHYQTVICYPTSAN